LFFLWPNPVSRIRIRNNHRKILDPKRTRAEIERCVRKKANAAKELESVQKKADCLMKLAQELRPQSAAFTRPKKRPRTISNLEAMLSVIQTIRARTVHMKRMGLVFDELSVKYLIQSP
jgi:hypothetical protein